MIEGDARTSLEREARVAPGSFDVIVVDAFSGDAIPVHLLTREAWQLYRRLLKPDGWLAVDITNRHIGLTPVIRAHHNAVGHHSLIEVESAAEPQLTIYGAWWLLVASNRALLSRKRVISNSREVDSSGEQVEWTDERASVLPVLHF